MITRGVCLTKSKQRVNNRV